MKPRARRVAIGAAVLGAGVVGVLVALNWGTVRDHVEAWHFQLTTETEMMEPKASMSQGALHPDELLFWNVANSAAGRRRRGRERIPVDEQREAGRLEAAPACVHPRTAPRQVRPS